MPDNNNTPEIIQKMFEPDQQPNLPEGATISLTAIFSFLCGILAYLVIPIIPAIILGLVALAVIKSSNGALRGKWLAIVGITLGVIFLVFYSFLTLLFVYRGGGGSVGKVQNEMTSIDDLRALVRAEDMWKANDLDRNGIKDFWTYDVSCLYRLYNPNDLQSHVFTKAYKDVKPWGVIDRDIARADYAPADYEGEAKPFGPERPIESWMHGGNYHRAYHGYYFRAIPRDEYNVPYNQDPVGRNRIPAANAQHFAFEAFPAKYGATGTGIRTFIVNERGIVYGTDTSGVNDAQIANWPGPDPRAVTGPGGQKWIEIEMRND